MQLKEYLFYNRLTTRKFAEILDIHPNYLSKLVSGELLPSRRLSKMIEIFTQGQVKLETKQGTRNCPHCHQRLPKGFKKEEETQDPQSLQPQNQETTMSPALDKLKNLEEVNLPFMPPMPQFINNGISA